MSENITKEVSDRICNHMNKDHAEALITYAEVYGKVNSVNSAKMLNIDSQGMDLALNDQKQTIRITFDHTLADAKDAHTTLVEMLKQVKS